MTVDDIPDEQLLKRAVANARDRESRKAPVEPPNAARDRIVADMREKAAGGSRFARDWLRKENLE